ncbi:hypothetical protein [Dyella agri]|uniref:Uncharacterized protein n=1 Tax=Dyella agri TaxID=1926869 RepID=A0ABW8KHB0_9GAMM
MSDAQDATLLRTVRTYWRAFAPAWIFPAIFLFGGLASDRMGHPNLFFFAVLPLFFWSFSRATGPWRRGEIRYWHGAFWCLVVPFIVWGVAVFAHLAVVGR